MNDHSMQNGAIEELLKSVNFMIQSALKNTTKIYNGFVVSNNNDGRWNIQYNGEIHPIQAYGAAVPTVGMIVKVIVPQGNQALSWFFVPIESSGSSGGTTFIPSVSQDGIISWTNDGGLPNPTPVNIRGPQGNTGEQGLQGETGPQGSTGPYFTPSVSDNGNLSWTNNGGLQNPNTVNIMGPQGKQGIQGPKGETGETGTQGPQGIQGETGPYFVPSVDTEGNLSWSNTGNLQNPQTVNIKGPQGAQGIQGEQGEIGPQGEKGNTGPYYTPSVDSEGNLSWTNNGSLSNPSTVNIKGPQGIQGEQGEQGVPGNTGPYFTPSVDSNGNLSWSNNGGLNNPDTVNIRGPQGTQGIQGPQGPQGEMGPQGPQGEKGDTGETGPQGAKGVNATINGVETLNIVAQNGITGTQNGSTYTISGENIVSLISDIPLQYQNTATIGTSGWVQSGNQYYLQINLNNISGNMAPILIPQFDADISIQSAQQTAINSILYIQSFNGYIRIFASSPFSTEVSIIIYY